MFTTILLKNNIVVNVMCSDMPHIQIAQTIFNFLKIPNTSYLVLKCGDNLSRRYQDLAQNMILEGCDLERPRSSMKVKKILSALHHLPISRHVKFHKDFIFNISGAVKQSLTERWPEEEGRKRNTGKTLWCTLTLCYANYAMRKQPDVKVTRA